jgi:hypothetical protein
MSRKGSTSRSEQYQRRHSGLKADISRHVNTGLILESLNQSLETLQKASEFKSVDEILFLRGKWRQRKIDARPYGGFRPVYWLLVSELAWGFGVRPIPLVPFSAEVILLFALVYFAGWRHALLQARPAGQLFERCLLNRVRCFVPDKLFERAGLSRLLAPQLFAPLWIRAIARLESLLGLGVATLGGSSVVRWMKQSLSTLGDKN